MATDDKYDRQIRLWGGHGQKALMESKVCILGSSPCATETLKNIAKVKAYTITMRLVTATNCSVPVTYTITMRLVAATIDVGTVTIDTPTATVMDVSVEATYGVSSSATIDMSMSAATTIDVYVAPTSDVRAAQGYMAF